MTTVWREDKAFYGAAKFYFGSWRKALLAAGIATSCYRTWTSDQVLEDLRCSTATWSIDDHASGKTIVPCTVPPNATSGVGARRC